MRRLLCIRRQVPLDRADEYLSACRAVRRAAEEAGSRAWLFRGAEHDDWFMEFFEWSDAADAPLRNAGVRAALADVDAIAAAVRTDEWEEAE